MQLTGRRLTAALGVALLTATLATLPSVAAGQGATAQGRRDSTWGPREAEHLLNRAGFGATSEDVRVALGMGRGAVVEELLAGTPTDPFFYEPPAPPDRAVVGKLSEKERRKYNAERRAADRRLLSDFTGWWVDEMIASDHPLRERMTLFWHGHFTSSFRDVRDSSAMIEQNELLRAHALGSFADLVRGIVRDPAMLVYLDNNQNRKGKLNENFARELMELFTLGEGHYTERDVKEAARALTGWIRRRGDDARFVRRQHDTREKTILGRTGKFDADDLVDILLEQPACPRWIAGKLLTYFEGRAPDEERLETYARLLTESDYEVEPFLRRLFNDPAFYGDDVMGARIASPIDYLVGTARRLGVDAPGRLLWLAGGQLGERLLDPPNVKGWEGGRSWITTSTFLQRGNFAGMMLGVVSLEDVLAEDPALAADSTMADPAMTDVMDDAVADGEMEMDAAPAGRRPGPGAARRGAAEAKLSPDMNQMKRVLTDGYRPGIHLSSRCLRADARSDAQVVEFLCAELLAVPVSDAGRATLLDFLARERGALEAADGELFGRERAVDAEKLLRRLAHLILSLPEAQLV